MRYRALLLCWLVCDLLLFVGAYTLAYFLRVGWVLSSDFPFDKFIVAAVVAAPLWLAVLATTRTFHYLRNQMTLRVAAYIAFSSLVGVALFTLVYYFQFTVFFSRLLLIYAFVLSTVVIWLWHGVYQYLMRMMLRRDPPAFPTLIVGVTRESEKLIRSLNKKRNPLKPVAILDGRGTSQESIDGAKVLGKLNKLEEILDTYGITHLIQCSDLEQSLNLLSACRQRGITYMLLPSVLGIVERDERVESIEGNPVTMVSPRRAGWMKIFG